MMMNKKRVVIALLALLALATPAVAGGFLGDGLSGSGGGSVGSSTNLQVNSLGVGIAANGTAGDIEFSSSGELVTYQGIGFMSAYGLTEGGNTNMQVIGNAFNGEYFDSNVLGLPNNAPFDWNDSGGTARQVLNLNASNVVTIGGTGVSSVSIANGDLNIASGYLRFGSSAALAGSNPVNIGYFNTGVAINYHLAIIPNTAPSIASGCGSGATITTNSSDNSGQITVGTSPSTCVVDFQATFAAAPVAPICEDTSNLEFVACSASTSALTITSPTASHVINWWLVGS